MTAPSRLTVVDFLKKRTEHGPPFADRIPFTKIKPLLRSSGFEVIRAFRPNAEEYAVVARRKPA